MTPITQGKQLFFFNDTYSKHSYKNAFCILFLINQHLPLIIWTPHWA